MKCVYQLFVYNNTSNSRLDITDKLKTISDDNNNRYSQANNKIPKLGLKKS